MTDDKPVVHIDGELHAEIWNRIFYLLPRSEEDADTISEATENIFDLIREYAPIIMQAAQGQAEAERIITAAVLERWAREESEPPLRRICTTCGTINEGYGEPDNCCACAEPMAGGETQV